MWLGDGDFARGKFGNLKVAVLLTSNPLFDEVRKRYSRSKRFVEQEIVSVTVELAKYLNSIDLDQVKQIVEAIQQRLKCFDERS